MANIGTNRGRRLRMALSRFAAMLIEEVRDLTNLTYAEIDEQLDLCEGQAFRYAQYPIDKKTRAPQAASIQNLENRVAKRLKRSAHKVVVQNTALGGANIGAPDTYPNLGSHGEMEFVLGYSGDWPTYRRLKYSDPLDPRVGISIAKLVAGNAGPEMWTEMLLLYSWQWGILWDRGLPWLVREMFDQPPDAEVMSFLPEVAERAQKSRARYADIPVQIALGELPPYSAGNPPEWYSDLCSSIEIASDEFHSDFR